MGGSPKALRQHLAGETSLLGDYRSPTVVARASHKNREKDISALILVKPRPSSCELGIKRPHNELMIKRSEEYTFKERPSACEPNDSVELLMMS